MFKYTVLQPKHFHIMPKDTSHAGCCVVLQSEDTLEDSVSDHHSRLYR